MRVAASIALMAMLAIPAFAAPTSSAPEEEEAPPPSIGHQALTGAAGGAASGAVSNLLDKLESLFRRDLDLSSELLGRASDLQDDFHSHFIEERADDKKKHKHKGHHHKHKGKKGKGKNKHHKGHKKPKKAKAAKKPKKDDKKPNIAKQVEERSPKGSGAGGAIASSAAGGAASAVVSNLLTELENHLRRSIDELETRAPKGSSVGGDIASSAAGGAASAVVGNLLTELENHLRRDVADGEDDEDDEHELAKRDVSSIGTIIQQSQTLSPVDKNTVKTALMNKIGTLQGKRVEAVRRAITANKCATETTIAAPISESIIKELQGLHRRFDGIACPAIAR